jgi:transposase
MQDERQWFVGVDWATTAHQVRVSDARGAKRGERSFGHDAEGLAAMAEWILALTGAPPAAVHVAIEVPHGPVVESLMERGFRLYAINPKQLDRFRDRLSPAGAKDDSRDAEVLADALRTDPHCLRALAPLDPIVVELRGAARLADELKQERVRLAHRVRELLWRYQPQLLTLGDDFAAPWFLELCRLAPTPEKAARLRASTLERLIKRHRLRRLDADAILAALRTPAIALAPGTVAAASAHLLSAVKRLDLVNRELAEANRRLDRLIEQLAAGADDPAGQGAEQRDAAILRSSPGVGRTVLAALLAEAPDALRRRDYHALRCLAGTAPITKRSGKSCIVRMRRAVSRPLRNALYHWARIAMQRDPRCRSKYAALRARGHAHARALRSLGDFLLRRACVMLASRTLFDPARARRTFPIPSARTSLASDTAAASR